MRCVALCFVLMTTSCDDTPATDFTTPVHGLLSVNAAYDYSSGTYAVMDLDNLDVLPDILPVAPDAVASCEGGRPWIIERLGYDTLTALSAEAPFEVTTQHSVGNGANPQSMVLLDGGDALITLLGRDYLLVMDPETGEETSRIDLAWAADDDGLPEASLLARAGDLVVVGIQRHDRTTAMWEPMGPGWLVLVDPASVQIVDADGTTPELDPIILAGINPSPYAKMAWDGTRLWVATVGHYGELDGGLEKVDLLGGASDGIVVTEEDLGGDLTDYIVIDEHTGFATVITPGMTDKLVRFDPSTGAVEAAPLLVGEGFTLLQLVEAHDGRIVLVDRNLDNPGLKLLDPETGAVLDHVHVGVHPFSICAF